MLDVQNVYKLYAKTNTLFGRKSQTILSNISFVVEKGECMGLVGESGSGKSTLSRLILGLEMPSKGDIQMDGQSIMDWKTDHPGQMSVVFQDYSTSVNPKFTVAQAIAEPLAVASETRSFTKGTKSKSTNNHGLVRSDDMKKYIINLLDRVELSSSLMTRYPHELSGGQLQRICIARAIATRPEFILFDEALSSLDIPIQSQILELLAGLKRDLSLTYLFITHDLMSVTALCDRVLFLNKGEIVESIKTTELSMVQDEYAMKLLASATMYSSGMVA